MRFFSAASTKVAKLKCLNSSSLGNLPEQLTILDANSKQKCDQCQQTLGTDCLHMHPIIPYELPMALLFLSNGSVCLQLYFTPQNLGLQFK